MCTQYQPPRIVMIAPLHDGINDGETRMHRINMDGAAFQRDWRKLAGLRIKTRQAVTIGANPKLPGGVLVDSCNRFGSEFVPFPYFHRLPVQQEQPAVGRGPESMAAILHHMPVRRYHFPVIRYLLETGFYSVTVEQAVHLVQSGRALQPGAAVITRTNAQVFVASQAAAVIRDMAEIPELPRPFIIAAHPLVGADPYLRFPARAQITDMIVDQ